MNRVFALPNEEERMRRYTLVSGLVFALVACGQLVRLILQWPVRIASVDVPVWASGVAVVIAGALAIWAFRSGAQSDRTPG